MNNKIIQLSKSLSQLGFSVTEETNSDYNYMCCKCNTLDITIQCIFNKEYNIYIKQRFKETKHLPSHSVEFTFYNVNSNHMPHITTMIIALYEASNNQLGE